MVSPESSDSRPRFDTRESHIEDFDVPFFREHDVPRLDVAMDDILAMGVFEAFQIPYSGLEREHEGMISKAAALGAGTIIRGGVARGAPAPDQKPDEALPFWRDAMVKKRDLWEEARMDELTDGLTRMEFMLRMTLSHSAIDTVIVGTANPLHLNSNVAAAAADALPADVYAEAQRRLNEFA